MSPRSHVDQQCVSGIAQQSCMGQPQAIEGCTVDPDPLRSLDEACVLVKEHTMRLPRVVKGSMKSISRPTRVACASLCLFRSLQSRTCQSNQ